MYSNTNAGVQAVVTEAQVGGKAGEVCVIHLTNTV